MDINEEDVVARVAVIKLKNGRVMLDLGGLSGNEALHLFRDALMTLEHDHLSRRLVSAMIAALNEPRITPASSFDSLPPRPRT